LPILIFLFCSLAALFWGKSQASKAGLRESRNAFPQPCWFYADWLVEKRLASKKRQGLSDLLLFI